jgi:tryptophanyl-tRNA synthetase
MIQFKEKGNGPKVRTSLLTYPCLMAADILLYSPEEVPVGEDQRQHIELCRDLAHRFNEEYGKVFTVPGIRVPKHGARLADLSDPSRKMSKSAPVDSMGVVRILDTPEVIRKKFKRAVTDSENVVAYDPDRKPGVSTLLGIIGEISGRGPEEIAAEIGGYADLKARCADAVIQALAPIREAHDVYMGDPAELRRLLDAGAARAAAVADEKLALAREAIGLDRRPDGR